MQLSLSWIDVLKLSVPLAGSLAIVWIRAWLATRRESGLKRTGLWRIFVQASENLPKVLDELNEVAKAYAAGRPRSASFSIPLVVTNLANRLAEIDPVNAYLYGELCARVELCNRGLDRLDHLTRDFANQDKSAQTTLVTAIWNQVQTLKENVYREAQAEFAIMEVFHQLKPRRFARMEYDRAKNVISDSLSRSKPIAYSDNTNTLDTDATDEKSATD